MVERRRRDAKKGNGKRNRHNGHADVRTQGEPVVQRKRPSGFQPGHKKYGGRLPGTPNNGVSKAMHEWTDEAARLLGSDGKGKDGMVGFFLSRIEENPDLFFEVMAKLQPRCRPRSSNASPST
jgi:hypothetical protein